MTRILPRSSLKERLRSLHPTFSVALEIERDIAPLPVLRSRLKDNQWSAGDIVTLVQIFLQSGGETRDWQQLGDQIIADGLQHYISPLADILDSALTGRQMQGAT